MAAIVALASGVLVTGATPPTPAGAQTGTKHFVGVQCTANVSGTKISQSQDITITVVAPDQVAANAPFTVTIPGATNQLPAESNGFTITSYRDLSLSYQVHGSVFTTGTIQNPGIATINGDPTPNTAAIGPADVLTLGQPGPFPPGTLVTPDVSVDARAGTAGSSITMNALRLTTTARLNNSFDAQVTCDIPQDTVVTIPVVAPPPAPTANAGPDVTGDVGSAIALQGSVSSSVANPSVTWSAIGVPCRFADVSTPISSITCSRAGTYTATLTVSDGVNPPVSDTTRVTITQPATLVVDAGAAVSGTVGHAIALDGLVSDPGRTPTSRWTIDSPSCTFADAASPQTTVTCTELGTFTARLTANDGGADVSDTTSVTVHEDLAPVVDAGPDVSGDTKAAIRLAGSAPDPEGDPVTAQWTASDPHCTFADPAALVTTITCTVEGDSTATLTAGDAIHPATSDTVAVKVRDVRVPFDYVVDATTHLKKLNQDVTIPTGTFRGVINLTTGALTGDIVLPPAQMTMSLAGIGLVTANMQIVERQPVTGTLDVGTFAVNATAVFDIRIPSAYPSATPTVNLVGDSCATSQPVSVTMAGTANLTGPSTFSSTYTIPDLENCGLATTALNLVVPGPDNTFRAVVQPPPAAPAVTTDPVDQTVADGGAYSFGAAASGYPAPAQQWQRSTDGGTHWSDIPGATGATYSGTGALSDSGTRFRSVFSNASGSAGSAAAVLTVAVPPDAPVIGGVTARRGGAEVDFGYGASDGGSPVLDATATCTSTDGGAAGSATAPDPPITVSDLTPGASYRCSVTARNVVGTSEPSAPSDVVVPTSLPVVTTDPQDVTVAATHTYSFTAAANGVPAPTVQWQVSADGGSSYTDLAGATGTTYSATASLEDSGELFRAVFTNAEGSATTAAASLTVTGIAPQVQTQPADTTVDAGVTYSFSAAASGIPAPTMQWQRSTDNGLTYTDIAGATFDPLSGTATVADSGTRFRAVFTNTEGSTASAAATLYVVPSLALSVGRAAVVEGDGGGARTVSVPVTLSQPTTTTVSVRYTTVNGSATAPGDYTTKSGTLSFAAGATVRFVTVPVKADTAVEPDETVTLRLSAPTGGAGIAPGRDGTVTILNDDAGSGPRVDVSDVAIWEGNGGSTPNVAKVLVTLSAPATSTMTVRLTLAPGSAGAADYVAWAPKTVTFQAGQFQKVFSVSVRQDRDREGDETARFTLSAATGGLTLGRSAGTLTILDDDS